VRRSGEIFSARARPRPVGDALDLTARKVLELHFTQKTAARPVIAPPDVPADRIAILRKAFAALAQDKEFLAEAEKGKIEFGFVSGEEVDKVVALITATPPDIADRYAKAFGAAQ
jgi:ABC-type phosphate/phosphonate transport system substrate-binding protein